MKPTEFFRHLSPVRRYVDTHISESIRLKDAARVAGLSRTYFSTLFRQQTCVCFKDWLRSRRVAHATRLLVNEDRTITEIAFASGFGCVSTLERSFRSIHGVTPSEYRDTHRTVGSETLTIADFSGTLADHSETTAEPRSTR